MCQVLDNHVVGDVAPNVADDVAPEVAQDVAPNDGDWDVEQLLWDEFQLLEDIESEHEEMEAEEAQIQASITRTRTILTMQQRRIIVDNLLAIEVEGKIPWGFQTKLANQSNVHKSTISRIYRDVCKQRAEGNAIDLRSKKYGRCGRKPKQYSDEFLQSCPLHLRSTIRSFAGALKLPYITVYRLLKKGRLRSHTNSTHPRVTEKHKLERMKWVLAHLLPATPTRNPTFIDMQNVIHIDEKWFYSSPNMRRFYLLPFEEEPYRCFHSKKYSIKIMFMGAIGRPIFDNNGYEIHDGKYGIFPFVEYIPAKRNSKNRAAGTIETKPIHSVTQQVIRRMLIDNVIPAIMEKWPAHLPKHIQLQQDNARPHIKADDIEFTEAATKNGFHIELVNQPPQSPDLNMLDLCNFRSVQSVQHQAFPKTTDELIARVHEAYDGYETKKIKHGWLQLQYVMEQILKCKGGNNYKNPHHGKAHMERIGCLPHNVSIDQSLVDESVSYLNERLIPIEGNINYLHEPMEVDEI